MKYDRLNIINLYKNKFIKEMNLSLKGFKPLDKIIVIDRLINFSNRVNNSEDYGKCYSDEIDFLIKKYGKKINYLITNQFEIYLVINSLKFVDMIYEIEHEKDINLQDEEDMLNEKEFSSFRNFAINQLKTIKQLNYLKITFISSDNDNEEFELSVRKKAKRSPHDMSLSRKILFLHYFNAVYRINRKGTKEPLVRLYQFLLGYSDHTIRTAIRNPLAKGDSLSSNYNGLLKDMEYVQVHFKNLGLIEGFNRISNDILSYTSDKKGK